MKIMQQLIVICSLLLSLPTISSARDEIETRNLESRIFYAVDNLIYSLNYLSKVAEQERDIAVNRWHDDQLYLLSDRASNTRHFVDADLKNALRDGYSFIALREIYLNLGHHFRDLERIYSSLPFVSANLEEAMRNMNDMRLNVGYLLI